MNNDQLLIDQFLNSHPELVVSMIEELDLDDISRLVEDLALEQGTLILTRMSRYRAGKVMEKITLDHALGIVERLPLSSSESILRNSTQSFRNKILNALPVEQAKFLKRMLSFNKNQIGAHMNPPVLTLRDYMTIEHALQEVKRSSTGVRSQVFVLEQGDKLKGYVELHVLMAGNPQALLSTIIKSVPQTVYAEMNVKDVLDNWNDAFVDLPVVRAGGLFLGTVSRGTLKGVEAGGVGSANSAFSAVQAGNALGDLYLIGLTGLLGSADRTGKD